MADEKEEKGFGVAEERSAVASARNEEEEDEEITKSSLQTTEALLRLIPMSLCVVFLVIMLKDSQNVGDYEASSRFPTKDYWTQMLPKKIPSPSSAPSRRTHSVSFSSSGAAKVDRKPPSLAGKV